MDKISNDYDSGGVETDLIVNVISLKTVFIHYECTLEETLEIYTIIDWRLKTNLLINVEKVNIFNHFFYAVSQE
jgi:hypothetical protein